MKTNLSVIMGAYNCGSTLTDSVKSILNQTYEDFLCYICDDGSIDNTWEVIQNLAKEDKRIIPLQNEKNSGLSHSLNKCIEVCDSKYIARMDGDDIAEPNRFEVQVGFMESHPEIDFSGAAIRYFDNNGFWGNHIYPKNPKAEDFLFTSPFNHPTVIYRADCLKKIKDIDGYIYSESPKIGRSEDYDLFMRMHAAGLKSYNIQEPLLQYREDLDSFAKRKFKYAVTEARVRWRNFRKLKLLPKGFLYVIKPLIVSLVPKPIRRYLHKKQYKR